MEEFGGDGLDVEVEEDEIVLLEEPEAEGGKFAFSAVPSPAREQEKPPAANAC